MWVLAVYESESEAALHEALTQTQFGIPGIGWVDSAAYKMPLDIFWRKVGDNSSQAVACLSHFGLLVDSPLWTRRAKPGAGWTTRVTTAAANIRSGMKMLTADSVGESNGSRNGYNPWSAWTPIKVTREWYSGPVYSLSVEVDHTYVADNVVTHNSFRFGPAIADQANRWLDFLHAEMRVEGYDALDSRVLEPDQELSAPDAILCRTNIGIVDAALRQLAAGRKVAVVGGIGDVLRLARAAINLKAGRRANHPDLAAFRSWEDFLHFVFNDPDGEQFRVLVAMVELYGSEEILSLGNRLTAKEADADVTISTGHKSKGREWDSVVIGADFAPRESDAEDDPTPAFSREAAMLAYVCTTRAKLVLDPGPLGDVPL